MPAKLAIKSENMTSFGGIFHVMDVFGPVCFPRVSEFSGLLEKSEFVPHFPHQSKRKGTAKLSGRQKGGITNL